MAITTMTMTTRLQFPGAINHNQTSFLGVPLRLSVSYPQPSLPSLLLNVHAKARTRREDRHARHSRIRKKVTLYYLLVLFLVSVLVCDSSYINYAFIKKMQMPFAFIPISYLVLFIFQINSFTR